MSEKDTTILKILARNMKKFRERKGWSQRQLAEQVGIDQSHISRIEKGTKWITLESLVRLSNELEVEPFELLQNDEVKELSIKEKLYKLQEIDPKKREILESIISTYLNEHELFISTKG